MSVSSELVALRRERKEDAEWLAKYKRIVDGLQQIAEIQADACNDSINEWMAVNAGLASLSGLIDEDIKARDKEVANV